MAKKRIKFTKFGITTKSRLGNKMTIFFPSKTNRDRIFKSFQRTKSRGEVNTKVKRKFSRLKKR